MDEFRYPMRWIQCRGESVFWTVSEGRSPDSSRIGLSATKTTIEEMVPRLFRFPYVQSFNLDQWVRFVFSGQPEVNGCRGFCGEKMIGHDT